MYYKYKDMLKNRLMLAHSLLLSLFLDLTLHLLPSHSSEDLYHIIGLLQIPSLSGSDEDPGGSIFLFFFSCHW